ncbi:ribonuclease P protein component [Candidatus Peregrinibacteria bacterium]|nr:ribonuclease P protein component [Candidatus Peregrinibacteria bacterium]MBI3816009.1 ribonuclease P protein component [Candidatus Peregrinibacteria bacterium]
MQLSRLRGRKVCERLLRDGMLWKGRSMIIRWLPMPPRHPSVDWAKHGIYLGTIASTRLDKSAVRRNRMRRRCREAWRTVLREIPESALANLHVLQLLVAPRSSSLTAAFADLQREVRFFLTSIHVPTGKKEQ